MRWVRGTISAVQEGRFRFAADDGRVLSFMLSHKCAAEPQDLPKLQAAGVPVRIGYCGGGHLVTGIAHRMDIEE